MWLGLRVKSQEHVSSALIGSRQNYSLLALLLPSILVILVIRTPCALLLRLDISAMLPILRAERRRRASETGNVSKKVHLRLGPRACCLAENDNNVRMQSQQKQEQR